MTSLQLHQWIQHPELLNRDTLYELRNLLIRYPYCQTFRLLFLKNLYLLHDPDFGAELRKSALYVTDRKVLFYLIEGEKYKIIPKPAQVSDSTLEPADNNSTQDRTLTLIDSFLSTVPDEALAPTEFDYVSDYTVFLAASDDDKTENITTEERESEAPKLRGQSLIDDFISIAAGEKILKLTPLDEEEENEIQGPDLDLPDTDENDSYFTETLARIYIKQKRYSKGLEIIKKLSLKYPKKNAYFADQIRFLEKLIINANSK